MNKHLIVLGVVAGALAGAIPAIGGISAKAPGAQAAPAAKRGAASAAFGKLPLGFVPNAGQAAPRVRYYAQGPGYAFSFTRTGVVFSFVKRRRATSMALRFVGASRAVSVVGAGRLPGTLNWFVGADRSKWRAGLPTYRTVVYRNVWRGIDMAFRGRDGALKYTFRVRPGARVKDIRLAYSGASRLSLDASGQLLVGTKLGVLRDSRPTSYQTIGSKHVTAPTRFVLAGARRFGFSIGTGYDSFHELVIDPGLSYSTYLGGVGRDYGYSIAVDEHGNAYVAGNVRASTFPATPGAFRTVAPGSDDAFVAKLNRSGSALLYSTYLGGSGSDFANDIAIDDEGNAFVTGVTASTDFPTTPGSFQPADPDPTPTADNSEGFVTKLNQSGSALVYSTYLGGTSGSSFDSLNGIAVDKRGNAFVVGSVCTSNYPTTTKAFQPSDPSPGPCDASDRPANNTGVVSELNPTGSALVYSTYLGGKDFNNINSMTIDKQGNVYVTGPADGDYPTTPGSFQQVHPAPGTDSFVTKLDKSGSKLVYSTFLGGSSPDDEGGLGIGVDDKGFAYVAGRTGSPDFPTTPGAYDRTLGGTDDAYMTKLNKSGSALVYSTLIGGSGFEEPHFSVAVDGEGRAYMTGTTDSTDFPTTPGAPQPAYGGGSLDGFVTVVNPSGSGLDLSTYLGGSGRDIGENLALDEDNSVYITGSTRSSDFPTTPGAFQSADPDPSGLDGFVAKIKLQNEDHGH